MTAASESSVQIPLCVDCDGTLISTDLLVESVLQCVSLRPTDMFLFPLWLVNGKVAFKQAVARRAGLDVATLPYRAEFLDYLRAERKQGRMIYLVTAADQTLAHQVSDHLRLFEDVIASDGTTNLKGEAKADRLVAQFGNEGFDYAGDHRADLPVWRAARRAITVAVSSATKKKLKEFKPPTICFPSQKGDLKTWLRLIRIHQWAKNAILFVPLVTSHRLTEWPLLLNVLLAFLVFGLAGSSTYIINDLCDIQNDRKHLFKKNRPIAAGEIAPFQAILCSAIMLFTGVATACLWLPPFYTFVLGCYLVLTLLYTLFFKKLLMMDVVVLAGLYTIRLIGGHAASGVPYSAWLLAFSVFIFFSLAVAKRYAELTHPNVRAGRIVHGRGYQAGDDVPILGLGTASGLIAVLVFILYVDSPDVRKLYTHPTFLLLICPPLLYWIGRVWVLAHRGTLHDDPVVFALTDRVSYLVALLVALILVLASV